MKLGVRRQRRVAAQQVGCEYEWPRSRWVVSMNGRARVVGCRALEHEAVDWVGGVAKLA